MTNGSENPSSVAFNVAPFKQSLSMSLKAIRDGMLWLVPCLMISSFIGLAAGTLDLLGLGSDSLRLTISIIRYEMVSLYPYLFCASISTMMAIQWRLPRTPIGMLSIVYLAISHQVMDTSSQLVTSTMTFVGITLPLLFVPVISALTEYRWTKILKKDIGGELVKDSMNLIIPAILSTALVLVYASALEGMGDVISIPELSKHLDVFSEPLESGLIYTTFNSLFWFIGINGYYALSPMIEPLNSAVELNNALVASGAEPASIMNMSFLSCFVFVGGSGATLGLVMAILLFSSSNRMRLIALASLPLGFLGINELLMFGLPLILNIKLLVPFVIAPLANLLLAFLVIEMGWVDMPSALAPIPSPIFFNAYISTGGDPAALVLQFAVLISSLLIYTPFIVLLEKESQSEVLYIPSLDTTLNRREEEAYILTTDPVNEQLNKGTEYKGLLSKIKRIREREFFLEYQPQKSLDKGKVVSAEALIRVKDNFGNIEPPMKFMPLFEKAGLLTDIDLWVVARALEDCLDWQKQGVENTVCVNIGCQTISSREAIDKIVRLIKPHPGIVSFEITEESLVEKNRDVERNIAALHAAGSEVHIDDFGTGYSSLSYLNHFEIDAIKIDRSFVLSLDTERGKKVLSSLMGIAEQLDLDVIVEGVETDEQMSFISQFNRVLVQGWSVSKSLSLEQFIQFSGQRNQ
ncbi:signal protein [Veronia nyctiphanis]|uniref:Signal protein n=1 Tax=Veronia nyctiphanis TaxID=1278244 RepID=A0A4Q0YRK6_9GAMM|nr:EAL domain-containing protein [Veronia nyctiphanis]RXJ73275.1 signal protein [Veronia nyctiphanis]